MKIVTLMSRENAKIFPTWLMDDGMTMVRPIVALSKPKRQKFRVVGLSKAEVWFDRNELDCEVYKSHFRINSTRDDSDPPTKVQNYQDFLWKSERFLSKMEVAINDGLSESGEVHQGSEDTTESDDRGDGSEAGSESQ